MNKCFDDTDRPPLVPTLYQLEVGEHIHVNTLPGWGIEKARKRLTKAVRAARGTRTYRITANRQHGGVTCERTS